MNIRFTALIILLSLSAAELFSQDVPDALNLSFVKVEQLSLIGNPDLAIVENETDSANRMLKKTYGYFLPEINLVGSAALMDPPVGIKKELIPGTYMDLHMGGRENTSYGVQIRYLLYGGGKRFDALKAAHLGEDVSKIIHAKSKRKAMHDARVAYIRVLFALEAMKLAKDGENRASSRLKQAEAKYREGALSQLEFLRVKTEQADAHYTLEEGVDRLKSAEDALRLTLGIKSREPFIYAETLRDFIPFTEKLANSILQSDELNSEEFDDVQIAQLRAKQAGLLSQIKKDELYPQIATGLSYLRKKPFLGQNIYGDEAVVQIQATIPIFRGGIDYQDYKIAENNSINARIKAEDAGRKIATYYKLLLEKRKRLVSGLEAGRLAVETARKALDASRTAWQNGAISHQELMDSELMFYRSEVRHMQYIFDILNCSSELEMISGKTDPLFEEFREVRSENYSE